MPSKKTSNVAEQTDDEAKDLILQMLTKASLDPKASMLNRARAIETLGRFKERSWWARPTDPRQEGLELDGSTIKRIADLSERLLTNCPHCGGKLS